MSKLKVFGFIIWVASFANEALAQFPLFKDGDRVCFIGNSITMNGRYHNYIELFYATRFPERKIEFVNCGISGDVAGGMLARMNSDILRHKPNRAVLMVGMNDIGRSQYSKERASEPGIKDKQQAALNRYFNRVDSIVKILLDNNIPLILQTPSIYDQTAQLQTPANVGANDALGKCADFIKKLAVKYQLPVVDYWTVMNDVNKEIQNKNPSQTIVGQDRVHPDTQGHFIMAAEFLKTQQAPGKVSVFNINANKRKVKREEQCTISGIKNDNSGFSFSCLESSLPYPKLSKDFNPDSLISFTEDFNKEILQIRSLKRGSYILKIDSVIIGSYSAKQLKKGINLSALITTPQYLQSEKVLNLLVEYWGYIRKLRQVKYVEYQLMDEQMRQTPLTKENSRELIQKRMEKFKNQEKEYVDFYQRNFDEYLVNKLMENEILVKAKEVFDKVYRANKPESHYYRLIRVNE